MLCFFSVNVLFFISNSLIYVTVNASIDPKVIGLMGDPSLSQEIYSYICVFDCLHTLQKYLIVLFETYFVYKSTQG